MVVIHVVRMLPVCQLKGLSILASRLAKRASILAFITPSCRNDDAGRSGPQEGKRARLDVSDVRNQFDDQVDNEGKNRKHAGSHDQVLAPARWPTPRASPGSGDKRPAILRRKAGRSDFDRRQRVLTHAWRDKGFERSGHAPVIISPPGPWRPYAGQRQPLVDRGCSGWYDTRLCPAVCSRNFGTDPGSRAHFVFYPL